MKRNPIEISNYIKNEFTEYISSTYVVDDSNYQHHIENQLQTIKLFNGPFLNTTLPFQKGNSINQLVQRGVLSSEFLKLSSLDFDRPLYKHQEDAINKIKEGRNLVVTTGTGSGKTESFLFPVLNYILSLIESGTKPKGVKAIFLYPMNALVNDQKERIRSILKEYPKITFGSFTGDTPYKRNEKTLFELGITDSTQILPNELISREEIRNNPPDLLFTNYSMLEYLLIRPEDYSIISPQNMENWKFMILDEAHVYKGSLGIELSFLMRRLVGLVNRQPQFILTSATLGDKENVGDIVQFAQNLTSSRYSDDDIIFSKREKLYKENISYRIKPSIYIDLKNNLENLQNIKEICSKYVDVENCQNVEECLYRILVKDENIYDLYEFINTTNTYDNIRDKFTTVIDINDQELTALVQLITLSLENGKTLFDAKFHMFISAPNRAFVTLGDEHHIRFGNYSTIKGYKAFEIGACSNCNHMYIIGNIVDGYLESNDSVDVYENYEETMNRKLDFFVLENENEYENLEEYKVCSKCGKIFLSSDLNASSCDCGEQYLVNLYRIVNDKSKMKNNISQCVHCGYQSSYGVMKSFYLNKDSATSILAQIYFAAIGNVNDSSNDNLVNEDSFDLFSFGESKQVENKDVKQLLAFSDSRQQASFFSTSFEHYQDKFMCRRLIWEELKNQDIMSVKSLASKLTNVIKENNVFDLGQNQAQSKAWISILSDILVIDGQYNCEGIGLYSYIYDYSDKIPSLKKYESTIKKIFNLSLEEFMTLLDVVVMIFRKNSAVDYTMAELSDQEKKDAFQYTDHEKYFTIRKIDGEKSYKRNFIISFLPYNQNKPNTITKYLMKICNCSLDKAIELAEKLLALMKNLELLKESFLEGMVVYQLKLERFTVKACHKNNWYVCDKCKKITLNNIHDCCIDKDCNGKLQKCNVDEYFSRNYYRKQYMNKEIEKITISEHTAQLSRAKGREVQNDFKNKKLNILSCSTTFEMGVDIGSLENVFLRNVPPTPANYVQRAGRAGRSKDSSALIVTYCNNTSHDYSYFNEPKSMIEGIIQPPLFDITNEKIVIRHILASSFGFFFRSHKELTKDIKKFIYDDSMKQFIDYLRSKPNDLGVYIDTKLLYSGGFEKYLNFGWLDDVLSESSKLMLFISEMMNKLNLYKEACEKSKAENNLGLAEYFLNQIGRMEKESVISTLSKYAVIPKYGFPVDVVSLNVMGNIGKMEEYNMQRDLSYAISEYAPDSEVIVDKNKYVSRYINTPKKNAGSLPRYYYYECSKCGRLTISLTPLESPICQVCNNELSSALNYFIIPELGFSTDKNSVRSKTTRPKKTFLGDIKYIGGGVENEEVFEYHDKLKITTVKNDQLLVLNNHKFFYCPVCGYTKIKSDVMANTYTERKNHTNAYGYTCECKKLERVALGHMLKTDVIKIELNNYFTKEQLITTVYALLLSMSKVLQIEINDINGLVIRNKFEQFELVLYDNVPGGAGHVNRLVDVDVLKKVLIEAYNIACQDCCDDETTCNKCFRTYYNQSYHRIMKKKYVKEVVGHLLSEER